MLKSELSRTEKSKEVWSYRIFIVCFIHYSNSLPPPLSWEQPDLFLRGMLWVTCSTAPCHLMIKSRIPWAGFACSVAQQEFLSTLASVAGKSLLLDNKEKIFTTTVDWSSL